MPRSPSHSTVIIGVGNEDRRDDAVGLIVARCLRKTLPPAVVIHEESGDSIRLMELWKGSEVTIIIDAAQSGSKPGHIHRFEARESTLPKNVFQYSTHTFTLSHAVELARAMNELPSTLVIYGIEGENFDEGQGLSSALDRAARRLADSIVLEVLERTGLTASVADAE